MTLGGLILGGLVKDNDRIQVSQTIYGTVHTLRGNWYQDHIIDLQNREICGLKWSKAAGWTILLSDEVLGQDDLPFR